MAQLPRNLVERVQADRATRSMTDGAITIPPDNSPYRCIEAIAYSNSGSAACAFIAEAAEAVYRRTITLYDRLLR